MSNHFFAYMARMRNIKRWGLMYNTFEENLTEHSLMTAVLAHALAMIRREIFKKPANPDRAAALAIYHDASEIFTGDLPTPVKYHDADIQKSYKRLEELSKEKLLSYLPKELQAGYAELLEEDRELYMLIKAADKLSAYIKCIGELRAGNNEFKKAAQQIRSTLDNMKQPEVAYFLENFIPSFYLTLDESE